MLLGCTYWQGSQSQAPEVSFLLVFKRYLFEKYIFLFLIQFQEKVKAGVSLYYREIDHSFLKGEVIPQATQRTHISNELTNNPQKSPVLVPKELNKIFNGQLCPPPLLYFRYEESPSVDGWSPSW